MDWKYGDIKLDVSDNERGPIQILNAPPVDADLPWATTGLPSNFHQHFAFYDLDASGSVIVKKAEIRLRSESGVIDFSK
jgi:hypothetical protein